MGHTHLHPGPDASLRVSVGRVLCATASSCVPQGFRQLQPQRGTAQADGGDNGDGGVMGVKREITVVRY